MPVDLPTWNSTILHLRLRLQSAERYHATLAESVTASAHEIIALRIELEKMEQLDKDLTGLMPARGEVRS